MMKEKELNLKIEKLIKQLTNNPDNTKLLHERAEIYTSLKQHGKAINDYLTILKINPKDKIADAKLDLLRSIIKYSNIDIYASPNTNMDPWMD